MDDLLLFPFGGNAREAALTIDAINMSRAALSHRRLP